jgi:hypothetical protein
MSSKSSLLQCYRTLLPEGEPTPDASSGARRTLDLYLWFPLLISLPFANYLTH